jgi:hypothetical protein
MVYNRIYTLESTKRRNMGEFYEFFWGITTECSIVNHRKITWEYKKWCIQHKLLIIDAYELTKYR